MMILDILYKIALCLTTCGCMLFCFIIDFGLWETNMANKRTCGNCVNCEKYESNGKEKWACENYEYGVGMPFDVTPPHDKACRNWSNDPKERNGPENELRYFVDHYWDERD